MAPLGHRAMSMGVWVWPYEAVAKRVATSRSVMSRLSFMGLVFACMCRVQVLHKLTATKIIG